MSPHQLAIWISIAVGVGVSFAMSLAMAFQKPEEPDAENPPMQDARRWRIGNPVNGARIFTGGEPKGLQ